MPSETPNASGPPPTVLHYIGANDDRGGIVSTVRALATTDNFASVLGVNPGFQQRRSPALPVVEFPHIAGEVLGLQTFWRARRVAAEVRLWLRAGESRIFHGHSRAGLAVALWLARSGEKSVVASVHCYGSQRWFYRWAARQLGPRLFWLSPAMKRYYAVGDSSWDQCIAECIPAGPIESVSPRSPRREEIVRLGGIGTLVEWKGWHVVVEALAAMPPALRRRISFRHIGAADHTPASERYAAELRAATTAHGLASAITWMGQQSSSAGFLHDIDCLIVASRYEPFSVAMLEALAAGVPVLAADSGGATDVIAPGKSGWFFRTGAVADLARGIARLVETDALAEARVTPEIVRPFLAPAVAARWRQVYDALGGR